MMKRFVLTCSVAMVGMTAFSCGSDTKAPLKVGVMPKQIQQTYFDTAQKGVTEAATALGITVDFNGPVVDSTQPKAARDAKQEADQEDQINKWVAAKYDAIAVSCANSDAIVPSLKAAMAAGVKVVTWDSDANDASARDFFVNQASVDGVAKGLMDTLAAAPPAGIGPNGKYVVITAAVDAGNQNAWIASMQTYQQATYPNMTNLSPDDGTVLAGQHIMAIPMDDVETTGIAKAKEALATYPTLQGIVAPTTVGIKTAAAEVETEKRSTSTVGTTGNSVVFVTGLGDPNEMRPYVTDGTSPKFLLWNPIDLGYLAVYAAQELVSGTLKAGSTTIAAGRLTTPTVSGSVILLGPPYVFDTSNIGNFNF